ncbi:MAG: FMN-dependent NADH-azoreductase [Saprospiraceae bacterium]
MKILHIDSSPRFGESISRQLSQAVVDRLTQQAEGKAEIIRRDVAAEPLPFADGEMIGSFFTPPGVRTEAQNAKIQISNTLVAELQAADVVVVGVPMWNFGVPASFKAWFDLVARVGVTFKYGPNGPEGLLAGKKVYFNIATGGTPIGSDWDLLSGHLKTFFGFLGIADQEIIAADGVQGPAGTAKVEAALAKAASLTNA